MWNSCWWVGKDYWLQSVVFDEKGFYHYEHR